MTRWLMTILLFLLLGAVVNVAVAWSAALSLPRPSEDDAVALNVARLLQRDVMQINTWGTTALMFELELSTVAFDPPAPPIVTFPFGPTYAMHRKHSCGWPLRSMSCELVVARRPGQVFSDLQGGLTLRLRDYGLRDLPLRPLPLGFTINTLFYAILLWLPICGPFTLRTFIRRRWGRCLKCGYSAGTSPTCTECGALLPVRNEQA